MAKIVPPLTVAQINAAKPRSKTFAINDGRGLSLYIYPTGKKVWRLAYKRADGKRDSLTLGDYSQYSLANARAWREEKLQALKAGLSLKVNSNDTFESVMDQWLKRWKPTVTQGYGDQCERAIRQNIIPYLGATSIHNIKAVDIVNALTPMEKRGKLEYLKRVKLSLKLMFNFACARGIIDHNPVLAVSNQAFAKHVPKHFESLSIDDLPQFMDYVRNGPGLIARSCALFQFLTMTRPAEAAHATWDEIDFQNKIWSIPQERMKKRRFHQVPLSEFALDVLSKMQGMHPVYIFLGHSLDKPISVETVRVSLRRAGLSTTAHGLRATASTLLNESGLFRSDVIEACLAHVGQNQVRNAYNHAQYLTERREALEYLAKYINNLSCC